MIKSVIVNKDPITGELSVTYVPYMDGSENASTTEEFHHQVVLPKDLTD